MAVRSTQGQNRAVRSTQEGRGMSPSFIINRCTNYCKLHFQTFVQEMHNFRSFISIKNGMLPFKKFKSNKQSRNIIICK